MAATFSIALACPRQAALLAGRHLQERFDGTLEIHTKNEFDEFVTDLDRSSDKIIAEQLLECFPSYKIHSEEHPSQKRDDRYVWVVDPLDGTANLVIGIPLIGVAIALLEDGATRLGVVQHVNTNRCYSAIQGEGAFLDGVRLRVSTQQNLRGATVGHIVGYQEKLKPRALNLVTDLRRSCRRMLDTWTPSLEWTLLASGKIDALVSLGSGEYDRLAGQLIAEEAGALVTDAHGNAVLPDSAYIIASNGTALHASLIDLVAARYE